jgi:hypothetical protein
MNMQSSQECFRDAVRLLRQKRQFADLERKAQAFKFKHAFDQARLKRLPKQSSSSEKAVNSGRSQMNSPTLLNSASSPKQSIGLEFKQAYDQARTRKITKPTQSNNVQDSIVLAKKCGFADIYDRPDCVPIEEMYSVLFSAPQSCHEAKGHLEVEGVVQSGLLGSLSPRTLTCIVSVSGQGTSRALTSAETKQESKGGSIKRIEKDREPFKELCGNQRPSKHR